MKTIYEVLKKRRGFYLVILTTVKAAKRTPIVAVAVITMTTSVITSNASGTTIELSGTNIGIISGTSQGGNTTSQCARVPLSNECVYCDAISDSDAAACCSEWEHFSVTIKKVSEGSYGRLISSSGPWWACDKDALWRPVVMCPNDSSLRACVSSSPSSCCGIVCCSSGQSCCNGSCFNASTHCCPISGPAILRSIGSNITPTPHNNGTGYTETNVGTLTLSNCGCS